MSDNAAVFFAPARDAAGATALPRVRAVRGGPEFGGASGAPARPRRVWVAVQAAWRRYRTRHNIAALDAHLLKDIGVSYAEAEAEANKPFWIA